MNENKYLKLFETLEDAQMVLADLTEMLEKRNQLLPAMEEKLAGLLHMPADKREKISRKQSFKEEKEIYQLSGYDPITKMIFLKDENYQRIYQAIEIERLIFHEYNFEPAA